MLAWLHVYDNYLDAADWFVKADDDTYMVMENLRNFLGRHDTNQRHTFGRLFKEDQEGKSYYSGGSGIIFSKGTLQTLGRLVGGDGIKSKVWAGSVNNMNDIKLL